MARAQPTPIRAAGFFALRTPLLPFDELVRWSSTLRAATADDVDDALKHDRALLRERLRALVARADVREALFLASPSLIDSLDAWSRDPESDRGEKVERALVRYVVRMCARATPFGLFAGCATGLVADKTDLSVTPRSSYRRHTRLDMDYLVAMTETLARELRPRLLFHPSSSLYSIGDEHRYIESKVDDGNRSYVLSVVERTSYLDALLDRARGGARLHELAESLVADDVTLDDATAYVEELVDEQILVPALAPAVTGPEPIHDLVEQLQGTPYAVALDEARTQIERIDRAPLGVDDARYREIAAGLSSLPHEVELPRLFQVDLFKPGTPTIGPRVVRELERGIGLLQRLSTHREHPALERFATAFSHRYEDRAVRLVDALDEESGIGFDSPRTPSVEGSPLLAGIPFAAPGDATFEINARSHRRLLQLLGGAIRRGDREIALTEADYVALEGKPGPWPPSFAAVATIVARSGQDADEGRFQIVDLSVGGSGAAMLGRFCHGDEALAQHVRAHLRAEEAIDPDAIFAEVVHLPEGRIGNILLRPLLRDHEIAFLGRSGSKDVLDASDLWVSIVDGKIVLRSQRLGRRVIPRLTTAHNFMRPGLGMYRFLCALQSHGTRRGGAFSWGALEDAPFLPRVVDGRLVLARARWRLVAAELSALASPSAADRFRRTQALRVARDLPRWITVEDGDNALLLDLDSSLAVDTFVQLTHRRSTTTLVERIADENDLLARGDEGRFVHEIVVPFEGAAVPTKQAIAPTAITRSFPPGSEWLYAKLYTGAEGADHALARIVTPLVEELVRDGLIDHWFFIRYGDPDWHVRVRFHGVPARLHDALARLYAHARPFLDSGRVWRMQLDTYEREVARYDERGIDLCEKLFHADSEAALSILNALGRDDIADGRWRLAFRSIDRTLDDLGLDLLQRHATMKKLRDSFAKEFVSGAGFDRPLGARYRRERAALEALLADEATGEAAWLADGFAILSRRSERQRPICAELRARTLSVPIEDLAGSLVHMSCNRLLRGAARAHERILYDFLYRQYDARLARRS